MKKVLIANRGAIAYRIIRTLKKMQIPSVSIFAEADRYSLHVSTADESHSLGEGSVKTTYLDTEKIIAIALECGADAIHPGYGFLSENPEFARKCEANGIRFLGPTPEQMQQFGLKHTARELAERSQIPLLKGTGLLENVTQAKELADSIGYPVILKSSAGGGGIGMQVCRDSNELTNAFETVKRLSANNFGNDSLFLERFVEKARHIEVQIFGDGKGKVVAIGERDCSLQRRNQKVIEECPAPGISAETRMQLWDAAVRLAKSIQYRSAGTVEFLYDDFNKDFFFLEMNTRLQVEHGVTEEVAGIDLVEWMLLEGAGTLDLDAYQIEMKGCAIQARVYAEDPDRNFQPDTGELSQVCWSSELRTETWIQNGLEITPLFDPMLAKLIAWENTREAAIAKLLKGIAETKIDGVQTNLSYLEEVLKTESFLHAKMTTSFLNNFSWHSPSFEVIEGGTETAVQDLPGRTGLWNIGVPPSGPMDSLNFALGNQLLGNSKDCAGLEITLKGPVLRFFAPTLVVFTGADCQPQLNGKKVAMYEILEVKSGDELATGLIEGAGIRSYLLFSNGLNTPSYMNSRSTFTLGKFGGYKGRALRTGDKVSFFSPQKKSFIGKTLPLEKRPQLHKNWTLKVLYGPHGAPDFFEAEYLKEFLKEGVEVHFNSSRTGIRLIAKTPKWARPDGGEAGLHPSNIHDNAYAIGTIDFTGDMPILLGPDGPSLGGFVCPFTIAQADLWKMGQLAPGDHIQFELISYQEARKLFLEQEQFYSGSGPLPSPTTPLSLGDTSPILKAWEEKDKIKTVVRQAGNDHLLIECGPLVLDLFLRLKIHLLHIEFQKLNIKGILDLTPGIRSLQIHFDAEKIARNELLNLIEKTDRSLPSLKKTKVPSRIIHLPLSWDDPATQLAIEKYLSGVRPNAPWGPSNIEFIRRINGLESIEDVYKTVFEASYLVMGLGDVYLGAPVATPVDPRHRLVTTKYNPARTWTPENAVGIGGAYMCIYGMEGPGGYQFVGRTIPIWNRYGRTKNFTEAKPWLLNFFDQIRFYPVPAEDLLIHRKDFLQGRFDIKIEETEFDFLAYSNFLKKESDSIAQFQSQQQGAFAAEKKYWKENGLDEFVVEVQTDATMNEEELEECSPIKALVPGSIWKVVVQEGQRVKKGEPIIISESMKTEFTNTAPCDGVIEKLLCKEGSLCNGGQVLAWLREDVE